jgi:hypothetical protein
MCVHSAYHTKELSETGPRDAHDVLQAHRGLEPKSTALKNSLDAHDKFQYMHKNAPISGFTLTLDKDCFQKTNK